MLCILKWILLISIYIFYVWQAENENLPPRVIKEIAKELKSLDESPPGGIKVVVNDDSFSTIFADIEGPGTVQKGNPEQYNLFSMFYAWARDHLFISRLLEGSEFIIIYIVITRFLQHELYLHLLFPFLAVGTPYECGIFQMKLVLTPDFPNSPPKGNCWSLEWWYITFS